MTSSPTTIYDTNYLVNNKKMPAKYPLNSFFFTDINMCEWLKGKNKEIRKREFAYIDKIISSTNSKYAFRSQYSKFEAVISSSKPINYRFKKADKAAKKVFQDLLEIYCVVCNINVLMVAIKECGVSFSSNELTITNEAQNDFHLINNALVSTWGKIKSNNISKIARALFEEKKDVLDTFGKMYYNLLVQNINKYSNNIHLSEIIQKHMNHNNLFVDNNVVLSKSELETVIKSFISFESNEQKTVKFITNMMSSFVVKEERFEFNDIADYYLKYISNSIGVTYITCDDRWKKQIETLHKVAKQP